MKSRAFTLIELLVVVLIIGILTAIALPKYQTAVQKSRYATLMPLAKTVKNAEEEMYLASSSYSNNLSDLSITLPGSTNGDTATSSDGLSVQVSTGDNGDYVRVSKTGVNNAYVMYFNKSGTYAKEIHCEALKENSVAKQVCLSYGPVNVTPIAGTNSSYDSYVLEGTGVAAASSSSSGGSETTGCGNDCWYGEMSNTAFNAMNWLRQVRF